jgi:hypothetical protein
MVERLDREVVVACDGQTIEVCSIGIDTMLVLIIHTNTYEKYGCPHLIKLQA